MKTVILLIITVLFFSACESTSISAKLVGKWQPSYMIQNKNVDGTWGPWLTINTLVALPGIEFTADGRFLRDGKDGADCCYAGNKYKVIGNKIAFTEIKACPQVSCAACEGWMIERLETDTLVIELCDSRSKYFRQK